MTRRIRIICLSLVALAIATSSFAISSFAADLPRRAIYKAPPPPPSLPTYNWNGLYIGANGGYAWGKADASYSGGSYKSDNMNGWLAGGTLGYNMQTGVWVWGLEGDIGYSWIKGNASNTTTCGTTCEVKVNWLITGRGRIGYAMNNWMPFATGGAAFARVKVSPSAGGEAAKTSAGWTVGGGIEYGFSPGLSAKVEYLYADLGKTTCDASICAVSTDFTPKLNIVRAGLNYRF